MYSHSTKMRARIVSLILVVALAVPLAAQAPTETITIDANAPAHPFPHFWEQMFGSGRAVLSLRDSYRQDLWDVHNITRLSVHSFSRHSE